MYNQGSAHCTYHCLPLRKEVGCTYVGESLSAYEGVARFQQQLGNNNVRQIMTYRIEKC